MDTKTLGPRQAQDARTSALNVHLYASDLAVAIDQGDLERVARLIAAMRSHLDGIDALVKRASTPRPTREG